ncbi:FlgD immunoglobulin-like domain containing protein [Calditrichota bacterium GD2]
MKNGYNLFLCILIFFSIKISQAQSPWFVIHDELASLPINGALALTYDLKEIYAVGNEGNLYETRDYGQGWNRIQFGISANLNSIAYQYGFSGAMGQSNKVNQELPSEMITYAINLVICGDGGNILRYDPASQQVVIIDTVTSENLNWVIYDFYRDCYWVVGDNGFLAYSNDGGLRWQKMAINPPRFDIKKIMFDYNYLLLFGDDSVNTYIKKMEMVSGINFNEVGTDTLLGQTFVNFASGGDYGYLSYFLTKTPEDSLYLWQFETYNFPYISYLRSEPLPFTNAAGMAVWNTYAQERSEVWVTTRNGEIWSLDDRNGWRLTFQDNQNRPLGPIIAVNNEAVGGVALGNAGFTVFNGFVNLWTSPRPAELVREKLQSFAAKFSNIPDLTTLSQGVNVKSNYSGSLPLEITLDAQDPSIAVFSVLRPLLPGAFPGESWEVIFSNGIHANVDSANIKYLKPFSFGLNFYPDQSLPFDYEYRGSSLKANRPSTNWVTAFFNEDQYLDLVTYVQDTLVVFMSINSPERIEKRIPMPGITMNGGIKNQLKTLDLNQDNLPDLLLFDSDHLILLVNNSQGTEVSFYEAQATYTASNIKDVIPFNEDENELTDLLILTFDISLIRNIDENRIDLSNQSYLYSNVPGVTAVKLGDIDGDLKKDLVFVDGGMVLARLADPDFGLGEFYYTDTLMVGDYYDIALADLDHAPPVEIVALGPEQVDAISFLNRYSNDQNYIRTLFTFANPDENQLRLAVDDFGGDINTDFQNILDIALINGDSLFIYQNLTNYPDDIVFSENPIFKVGLGKYYDQILVLDYWAQATPEMALIEKFTGSLDLLEKGMSWTPELFADSVSKFEVRLSWTPFPPDMGTLEYYQVTRSTSPDFNYDVVTFNVNDPYFVDSDVWPFQDFWYRVEAVYNGGLRSNASDVLHIKTYRELFNTLSGVLADTTLPYVAVTDLFVPVVDSLFITNGVEIAFNPNTGLYVYGKLKVIGGGDQNMVDFFERDSLWEGVFLFQNADTAFFEWWSMHGAKNGITVYERPLKMRFGGIVGCQQAMKIENSDFWLENMVIDSCLIGIEASASAKGFIKNIDVLRTRDFSLLARGLSTLNVKNSIIWENLGPVAGMDSAKIIIDYSTVDSIGQRVLGQHISRLAPLFDFGNDEDMFRIHPMSPTIDAGDPNDPFDLEPAPNGGRINQGTFGNTPWATPSLQPRIATRAVKSLLHAYPGEKDSAVVFIKNYGYAHLSIDSLFFKRSIFEMQGLGQRMIAPQDSMAITVLFRPPKRGLYRDTLLIACNDPHLPQKVYTLTFEGVAPNSKPVLVNQPPSVAFVDSLYKYRPMFTDLDDDSVIIQPVVLPGWLTLSNSGELIGTPAAADTGKHPVHLRYSDQHGGIDSLNYAIDVIDLSQEVQVFPIIRAFVAGGNISAQAAIQIFIAIMDSTTNEVKEATASYHIYGRLFKEGLTEPLLEVDTVGVTQLRFYPLSDGNYRFVLSANRLLPSGKEIKAVTEVFFKIVASLKAFDRFRWHMVAFPRPEVIHWEQFNYADSAAVLFRWNSPEKKYVPVQRDQILPGFAFWLMPLTRINFDLNPMPVPEAAAETIQSEIKLVKGWNQIGLPWPYFKKWVNMEFVNSSTQQKMSLQEAIIDTLIQPAVFWFEQSPEFIGYHVEALDSSTFARPWLGYWIYANSELSIYVENIPDFPPSITEAAAAPLNLAKVITKNSMDQWAINFTLQCDRLVDNFNVVGLSERPDALRVFEPPAFNEFVSLYVSEGKRAYCQSFKPLLDEDKPYEYWDLSVATAVQDREHHLRWETLSSGQQELYAYLVDLNNEKVVNLAEEEEYVFTPSAGAYNFRLYVSKDQNFKPSIIPLQYTLTQNFPNPFNPTTTIKVGIPENGRNERVTLKVFDVLGKEIKTLCDGNLSPGFHKFEWDGTNATGDAVASGIYFYQLQAGGVSVMRKMVLLR